MDVVTCAIRREVDVYLAIGRGRDMATTLGLDEIDRTRVEIAILELARNILAHASSGELRFELVDSDNRRGLLVEARDSGPGIPDIDLALRDGYSTTKTLGAGLPGVRRLMDDFTIRSEVGVGTVVRATKWLAKPRLRRQPGERQP